MQEIEQHPTVKKYKEYRGNAFKWLSRGAYTLLYGMGAGVLVVLGSLFFDRRREGKIREIKEKYPASDAEE